MKSMNTLQLLSILTIIYFFFLFKTWIQVPDFPTWVSYWSNLSSQFTEVSIQSSHHSTILLLFPLILIDFSLSLFSSTIFFLLTPSSILHYSHSALMSTCQVDSCSCLQTLPMRGNIGLCIGCNHLVSVHLNMNDDDIEVIESWNCKYFCLYLCKFILILTVFKLNHHQVILLVPQARCPYRAHIALHKVFRYQKKSNFRDHVSTHQTWSNSHFLFNNHNLTHSLL